MATRSRRRGVVRAGSLEPPGRHEGGSFGAVFEGQHDAPSPEDRHEEAEYERSIWVSISDLVFVTYLADFSILLNSRLLISSPGAVPKDAVRLAPAKALKTGSRSTPHTATQPQPAVDLEVAAARLREAMA